MSALISFLGGSVFRALWGEVSAAWQRHQEHRHELALMEAQAVIGEKQHAQRIEMIRLQRDIGVQIIEAKRDADIDVAETTAWVDAVKALNTPTGNKWLDIFRGVVQPLLAYIAIMIWLSAIAAQGGAITDWDRELVSAIFGMFLANRHLLSRGK